MELEGGGYALLFPGQGSQYVGMGWQLHDRYESVRRLFDEAEHVSGLAIRRLCFDPTKEELSRTENTQPCVFAVSCASLLALREELEAVGRELEPRYVCGHSLGQLAALVASGALGFDAGLRLVVARGAAMAAAGASAPGAMATILGLPLEDVEALCAVGPAAPVVAAVNGPDVIVVSGRTEAVEAALGRAAEAGAERVVRLPISVAAHTPLMAEAQARFARHVTVLELAEPDVPVVLNTTARPATSADEIRQELTRHMCSPVLWWPSIETMRAEGVRRFVEVAPGQALAKMLRRAGEDVEIASLDHGATLELLVR